MPYNVTIDHKSTRHNSSQSSSSGEEDESSDNTGVHLSPRSEHEYSDRQEEDQDGSWDVLQFNKEIGPSDSASRPRTSSRQRTIVEAPERPQESRRTSYRRHHHTHERSRNVPAPRKHRSPPSTEVGSVDTHEEWPGDARGHGRAYAQVVPGYPAQYQTYPSQSIVPAAPQHMMPYGVQRYQVAPQGMPPGYFNHGAAMMSPGGGPFSPPGQYFPYPPHQGYSMHQPMAPPMPPQPVFQPYPVFTSPPPQAHSPVSTPPPPSSDVGKDDDKFARLEKLIMDQEEKQAAKEAAAEAAAVAKAAKAAAEAERAKEIKEAADAAAKEAKEKADEEHKAATEKAAAEAAEAAEKAAAEAAAAAKPEPPKEKPKPIKFKDAMGRRFQFPFDICNTWRGMEFLIKEAFSHVEVIGAHVEQGHYDLLGPHGEIILPHVWETVVEPDWTITMHMWPMTEEKEEEIPVDGLGDGAIEAVLENADAGQKKKPKKPPPLFGWPTKKKKKGKKKAAAPAE